LWVSTFARRGPDGDFVFLPVYETWQMGWGIAMGLSTLAYVACTIAFCHWMYRAYKDAQRITPPGLLRSKPWWVVVSWFVPLVFFVQPYLHMRQLWQASDVRASTLADLQAIGMPTEFRLWWFLWLVGMISTAVEGEGVSYYVQTVLSCVADVAAALLAVRIVGTITERLTHKMHVLSAEQQ
jgi:hypothetical protein